MTGRSLPKGRIVELSPLKEDINISVGAFFQQSVRISFETEDLTDAELRQKLREKKLSTKGTHEQLVNRLNKALLKSKKPKRNK